MVGSWDLDCRLLDRRSTSNPCILVNKLIQFSADDAEDVALVSRPSRFIFWFPLLRQIEPAD